MHSTETLRDEIKRLLIENLMLQQNPADIADDTPLFGPGGLGLDSVDALQIVVALDKNYGLKIADPATAQTVLATVTSLTTALAAHLSQPRSA